jgi:hypothetical protein
MFTKIRLYAKKSLGALYLSLILQLFVTSFSLPILAVWGMNISLLTIIGNLIFSPILFVMLFLANFLFIGILVGIPTTYISYALNYFGTWWLYLMSFSSESWLITAHAPSWIACCSLIPLTSIYFLPSFTRSRHLTFLCGIVELCLISIIIYLSKQ